MKPITLTLILFLLISCKKDKLEGEKAILTGTWNWTETYRVSNHCDADSLWNYVLTDSATSESTYEMEFEEKGKVTYVHNGGKINSNRLVFHSTETLTTGPYDYHFVIYSNNNSDRIMELWVGQDSLLINDFPKDTEASCEEMFNHFVKH